MLQQVISRELVWLYPWLRRVAGGLMAMERKPNTLQPTALANEVLAKLLAWRGDITGDTEQSLRTLALTVAKQTLVDRGRHRAHQRKYRESQIADRHHDREASNPSSTSTRVAIVLEAVERLEAIDADLSNLIRLRFFEGLSLDQATQRLNLSPRTAARRWTFAKAYIMDAVAQAEARD